MSRCVRANVRQHQPSHRRNAGRGLRGEGDIDLQSPRAPGLRGRRLVAHGPATAKRCSCGSPADPRKSAGDGPARAASTWASSSRMRRPSMSRVLRDFFQWYGEGIDKIYDEVAPTGGAIWSWSTGAARGRRRGDALELPARHGDLESRGRAGRRQFGSAQARRAVAVLGPPARRTCQRREFRTACSMSSRLRRDGRKGARPAHGRGLPGLHRIELDRQDVPAGFGPVEHEAGLARTGGKSPNIVFADCGDLDAAADMAAFGIFFNQGEVCSANSRLLVHAASRMRWWRS